MTNDATTNVGFKGPILSSQLPAMLNQGARYSIIGAGHLKVTAAAGTRTLSVAAGTAWGDGILSAWTGSSTLTGTAVASSGYRWDTVYIRRTWQPASAPTGKAEIIIVAGSAAKTISGRTVGAGTGTSDQPLALVRFDYNSNAVTEIVDLRVWAFNSGMFANAVEVTQYVNEPGTSILIGTVQYDRVVNASTGAVTWQTVDFGDLSAVGLDGTSVARLQPKGAYGAGMQFSVADSNDSIYAQKPGPSGPVTTFAVDSTGQITYGNLDYSHLNGEVAATIASKDAGFTINRAVVLRRGDERELWLELHRSGATIASPANGNITDTVVATLNSTDSVPSLMPCGDAMYRTAGASGSTFSCGVWISGTSVTLGSLTPGQDLAQQTGNTTTSLWVHARWNR